MELLISVHTRVGRNLATTTWFARLRIYPVDAVGPSLYAHPLSAGCARLLRQSSRAFPSKFLLFKLQLEQWSD